VPPPGLAGLDAWQILQQQIGQNVANNMANGAAAIGINQAQNAIAFVGLPKPFIPAEPLKPGGN
jgi:hypothetical protein